MDGGAWWAVVQGVIKSRTQLSNFTFTFHFNALEKEMATHSSVLAWRIPGMGEPGGLPSIGSHRVGHNWSNLAAAGSSEIDIQMSVAQSSMRAVTSMQQVKGSSRGYFLVLSNPASHFPITGSIFILSSPSHRSGSTWNLFLNRIIQLFYLHLSNSVFLITLSDASPEI